VILLSVEFARGGLPNLPQGVDLAIHTERFKEFQKVGNSTENPLLSNGFQTCIWYNR